MDRIELGGKLLEEDMERVRSDLRSAAADALHCDAPQQIIDRLISAAEVLGRNHILADQRRDAIAQGKAALIAWKSWRDAYCE